MSHLHMGVRVSNRGQIIKHFLKKEFIFEMVALGGFIINYLQIKGFL